MFQCLTLYSGRMVISQSFQAINYEWMQLKRLETLCIFNFLLNLIFFFIFSLLFLFFDRFIITFFTKKCFLFEVETHQTNNIIQFSSIYIIAKEAMSNESNGQEQSIKLQEDQQQNEKYLSQQMISQNGQKSHELLSSKKRLHRKQEVSNFINKTYKILDDKRNNHIIQWTDNGNCFIVKNKQLFQNQILPKYFKHKKFSSFVRQLNMYDFHKIRKQKEIPIFKHKFFKMNCVQLLHKIKRKSGEDGKEDETVRNMISQPQILLKNEEIMPRSTYSIKSKIVVNAQDEMQQLISQNKDLQTIITDLNKQIAQSELKKAKHQQKLIKIFSSLIYFDISESQMTDQSPYSLRQLQNHFINQEQSYSFYEYYKKVGYIYRRVIEQVKKIQ